jgi:hypothetical protein
MKSEKFVKGKKVKAKPGIREKKISKERVKRNGFICCRLKSVAE